MKTDSENILILRQLLDLSQEELAKILGVTQVAVCKYENGKSEIGYQPLMKLINYCAEKELEWVTPDFIRKF